jgi:ubiquinone/menaquinone biosynthesis C-methylase UbiE
MAVALDPEEVEIRVMHDLVEFDDKDVLEIGCGDGRLTWRYADRAASVLALDPKEDEIRLARQRTPEAVSSRVTFQVGDITAIDLPAAAFDVAVLSWSI